MPSNCDQCVSCKQIPAVEKPLLINIHEDDPSSTYVIASSPTVPSSSTCFTNGIFLDFVKHVDLAVTRPPVIHKCHQCLQIKYHNKLGEIIF